MKVREQSGREGERECQGNGEEDDPDPEETECSHDAIRGNQVPGKVRGDECREPDPKTPSDRPQDPSCQGTTGPQRRSLHRTLSRYTNAPNHTVHDGDSMAMEETVDASSQPGPVRIQPIIVIVRGP